MGSRVAPPESVLRALRLILGQSVDQVVVIEKSLFARLHVRAIATTRRGKIFLRGSAEDFFGDPVLMLHEYCHVVRQWEPGHLTTPRYLRECLRCGYWNNPFEVEARRFAEDELHRFRALLARASG